MEINDRIRNASRGVKVGEVIGLGLKGSQGDEPPVHELLDPNGDGMAGGEMAVDVPAGRPSATSGGVTATLELSTCGRSGMSGLASGKLGTCGSGGGTNEGTAGLGGSSSWDSRALHSVDSSAGSCTKVTALVSHGLSQQTQTNLTYTAEEHPPRPAPDPTPARTATACHGSYDTHGGRS